MNARMYPAVSYVLGLMGVTIVDSDFISAPASGASDPQLQEDLLVHSELAGTRESREPCVIIRMESGPDPAASAGLR